jgi:putative chitinase
MKTITKQQLIEIVPAAARSTLDLDKFCSILSTTPVLGTEKRLAAFVAQCAHESGSFTRVTENLNYSGERLLQIFPKYFPTVQLAAEYARKPERIASRVYANRMGNGAESTMDGWKYRGRGFIQLTGKSNYLLFGKHAKKDMTVDYAYLETVEGATDSALWFWQTKDLNWFADRDQITKMTKSINGGYHGLKERRELYSRALKVL